jgi:glycosyltransferase involved in cell wall biosynthesis
LNNNPLVSIVTPVYNNVKYIEKTINSVLNQTYKNIQYIIIDGQSTDGTIEIINKYLNYINIFISEKDNGMYDALFKGFKLSKGKYLSWLNSDDLYFKNAIEKTIKYMEINNCEWIVGKSTTMINKLLITKPLYYYPNVIVRNGLASPCLWGYIPQESTFFSKRLYNKSGKISRKFRYAGDFDLWKRFSKHKSLISIPVKIGIFVKRKGQLSANKELYLKEINKNKCLLQLGIFIRLIFSIFMNFKNYYAKKK